MAILDQSATDNISQGAGLRAAANVNLLLASKFTPVYDDCIQINYKLYKIGSPTGNVWAEIYTDSGGSPNSQSGADSSTLDVSTLDTFSSEENIQEYVFTFSTPISLTPGTAYWAVINGNSSPSGTNLVVLGKNQSAVAGRNRGYWSGSVWSFEDTYSFWFKEFNSKSGFFAIL